MIRMALKGTALVLLCGHALTAVAAEPLPDLLKREMGVTDASLADCRTADGRVIRPNVCAESQRTLARAYRDIALATAKEQQIEEESRRINADIERDRLASEERQASYRLKLAEDRRRREERDAVERAELDRLSREIAQEQAARQARCKGDMNNPRIGMPIKRALECTEDLVLLTEERTASGVVRTYGDGSNFLRAAGGKVVAVGRY